MLAIFKTGGKQYSVKAGQILKVEKLDGSKGDMISFNDILAVTDSSDHTIGTPLIKDAKIEATILDQIRDKKIIVFKKRQRQNYRHTQGHRQYLTVLQIESIILGTKKSTAPKKEIPNKVTATEIDTDIAKENKEVKAKKVIKKSTDVNKTPTKKKTVKKTQLEK
jgi:large subunit ribosomal protein L21|tara:strand:+ start:49 stop:543 length:495 start_codon:yes stop_codon:yes gene_type:complete